MKCEPGRGVLGGHDFSVKGSSPPSLDSQTFLTKSATQNNLMNWLCVLRFWGSCSWVACHEFMEGLLSPWSLILIMKNRLLSPWDSNDNEEGQLDQKREGDLLLQRSRWRVKKSGRLLDNRDEDTIAFDVSGVQGKEVSSTGNDNRAYLTTLTRTLRQLEFMRGNIRRVQTWTTTVWCLARILRVRRLRRKSRSGASVSRGSFLHCHSFIHSIRSSWHTNSCETFSWHTHLPLHKSLRLSRVRLRVYKSHLISFHSLLMSHSVTSTHEVRNRKPRSLRPHSWVRHLFKSRI